MKPNKIKGEKNKPTAIEKEDFYGESLIEGRMLNRFTYKGRGRPKATDYSTLDEIQHDLNYHLNKSINDKK